MIEGEIKGEIEMERGFNCSGGNDFEGEGEDEEIASPREGVAIETVLILSLVCTRFLLVLKLDFEGDCSLKIGISEVEVGLDGVLVTGCESELKKDVTPPIIGGVFHVLRLEVFSEVCI